MSEDPAGRDEIALDADMLKALASDTRRDVLRLLRQRRMTLTEMAHALDLGKATVLEHLKKLAEVGLIRRVEDERLWVYYELTRQGGRIVNPGRTRLYLVMGLAAAAALVFGGILAAGLFSAPEAPVEPLGVRLLTREDAVAGDPFVVLLDVDLPLGGALEARLLDEAGRVGLLQGGPPQGQALQVTTREDGTVRIESRLAVAPGEYHLYVSDGTGRDNRNALLRVVVPRLTLEGPTRGLLGFDGILTFRLLREGEPARGSLEVGGAVLDLVDGEARLPPDGLDRMTPGLHAIAHRADGSSSWSRTGATFEAVEPLVAVNPLVVTEGNATVQATLLPAPDGSFQAQLAGSSVPVGVESAGDGRWLLRLGGLDAAEPESLHLGRRVEVPLAVLPDLRAEARLLEGPTLGLTFTHRGVPLRDAVVGLDGRAVGRTDEAGGVRFVPDVQGLAVLSLDPPGGPRASWAVEIRGWDMLPAEADLRVEVIGMDARGVTPNLRFRVSHALPVEVQGTLLVSAGGRPLATFPLAVEPGPGRESSIPLVDPGVAFDTAEVQAVAHGGFAFAFRNATAGSSASWVMTPSSLSSDAREVNGLAWGPTPATPGGTPGTPVDLAGRTSPAVPLPPLAWLVLALAVAALARRRRA